MKKYLSFLIVLLTINCYAQKMEDLYNQTIKIHLKTDSINNQTEINDTVYVFCGFCECFEDYCFGKYLLLDEVRGFKVKYGIPQRDDHIDGYSAYMLTAPELYKDYIVIGVSSYYANFENNKIDFILGDSKKYYFKYKKNSKSYKYIKSE